MAQSAPNKFSSRGWPQNITLHCPLVMCLILLTPSPVHTAPHLRLNKDRIYTPDSFEDLLQSAAHDGCHKERGCDAHPTFSPFCNPNGAENAMLKVKVDVRTNGGCDPFKAEVPWPPTGECFQLLTKGPCKDGEWLQLNRKNLEPRCAPMPCPGNSVMINGQCSAVNETSACPGSLQLTASEHGEGECDCVLGQIFHEGSEDCYTPYSQGPCPPGKILRVQDEEDRGHADCVVNSCPEPNMVPMNIACKVDLRMKNGTICHHLGTQGPCIKGLLKLNKHLAEPLCTTEENDEVVSHALLFAVPLRGCGVGSVRDLSGRCRRNYAWLLSRASLVTSRPGSTENGTVCDDKQIFMAGTCVQLGTFGG